MSWEQLQQYVYEIDSSWRDIYVLNATRADWKKWADDLEKRQTGNLFSRLARALDTAARSQRRASTGSGILA